MTLTAKQNHLKRLLKQYIDVSKASNLEELTSAALEDVESVDFDSTKEKIKQNLKEEIMLYHSLDLKFFLIDKTNLNPNIQRLLDESGCKDWF